MNAHGDRFYDEGEDLWPKRYAIWGRLVAQQPGQIAYSLLDAKAIGHFMPSMFPPKTAGSIPELARVLGLAPNGKGLPKTNQIVIVDMNVVEDEVVELVSAVLARMVFRLLRQADPRNRFPVHLLLEEAHRPHLEAYGKKETP